MLAVACVAVAATFAAGAPEEPVPEDGKGALGEERLEELLEDQNRGAVGASRRYAEEDFAPYFASPPLAEAKRAFDRGQYRKARALFQGDALPVRYMRALSAFRSRDYAAASSELADLAVAYAAMRDHCLYLAGLALEGQGQLKPAVASYDAVSAGSSPYVEARFAMVRVLRRKWDFPGAVAALKPLRELPATPRYDAIRRRTLTEIIDIQRRLGNYPAEYRAMIELWATSPLSREAESVWARLKQQPVPNPWRLRRAESFLSFHDNEEAIRLASQVRSLPPDDEACRAAFIVGNGHRKERRHRRAIAALAPLVTQCVSHPLRPQAMYVMGYSQSVVDPPNGIRTYEALAREYPDHPFADDALFFAAELYARTDQTRAALELLETMAARYSSGNFAADALFKLGWLHRERGDAAEAARAFERLEQSASAEHEDQLRARYWRARVLEATRDGGSLALYRRLATEDPTTWYGLLARNRVGPELATGGDDGALKACVGPTAWPREAGPLASDPRFLAGVEMLRMGLREAGAELMRIDRRSLPPDAARLLMDVFAMSGQERRAAAVARAALGQHLRGGIDGGSQKVWEAVYPTPFRDLVEKHAAKAKVDPDLVQALMREESRFNVRARSATGALGLTQLMPKTARKVAAALRMKGISEASLFRPEVNIKLGATYLGMLVAELNASVPHAVAAYNAGPKAVGKWLRVRGGVDLDAWVEEIPFAETRDYVKRVLASYAAYQLVYRGQTAIAIGGPRLPPAAPPPTGTTLSSGVRAR